VTVKFRTAIQALFLYLKLCQSLTNLVCLSVGLKTSFSVFGKRPSYLHAVYRVSVMPFNATLNNISVILWRSVLLMVETRLIRKKTTDKCYHIMLYQMHLAMSGIRTDNFRRDMTFRDNVITVLIHV
jgi:hypothetical protein